MFSGIWEPRLFSQSQEAYKSRVEFD